MSGRGTPAPFDPPRRLVIAVRIGWFGTPCTCARASLFYESWALLGYGAVFTLVMFLFVVVYEEPRLRATFGDAYVRYCEQVPRWWPRLPGSTRIEPP